MWPPVIDHQRELINQNELEARIAAQEKFCEDNDYQRFAPKRGICYHCKQQIYDKISLEQAGSDYITGCPFCHWSFCS